MVLEAVRQKQLGKSVCIFDDRERIGGAWYVKDLFGCKNVEVGCHFIYNNKEVYKFLQNFTGKELPLMNPQPKLIISGIDKNKELKSRWARFMYSLKKLLFSDRTLSCRQVQILNGLRETVQFKNPAKFFKGVKNYFKYEPYRYFDKGCGEFVMYVEDLIQKNDIKVVLNSRIRDVHVVPNEGGHVEVNDKKVKFKQLLMSKHIKFDSLTMNEKVDYERTPWRKKHFLFQIRGKLNRPFSYVDIANDPVLKRISDVGPYSDGLENGHCLICSDTTEEVDANNSNEEIKDLIFARLKELNFINQEAEMLNWFVEKFVSDYTPKDKIEELYKDSGGVITSIDTADLGKSLKMYEEPWGNLKP